MIGGLIALVIAAIGAAYAVLVIRAAPTRHDNVTFGALALVDATITAWRGISVVSGESIVANVVTLPCALGTIVLAVLTIEFVASFPRRASMASRRRGLVIAWALGGAIVVAAIDRAHDWSHSLSEWVFFAPATLFIFVLGARAWRRTTDRGERTVIAVLWFRWAFGFGAYFLGPLLHVFEPAVWAEATFATLVSFVVISTAVLRSQLFSIRSAVAEAITLALIALVVGLGGAAAVTAVLRYTEPGNLQHAMLVGATLVPLALAGAARAMYPRLEANVLAPLDDRRARRLGVHGEPLPAVPAAAIAEATRRIASIADGAEVRWRPVRELAPAVAAALRTGEPLSRALPTPAYELPACFVVPALGAERTLVGAFLIEQGTIDRDTYLVARDLAARVALAVERAEAVSELVDARRLAALGQFAAAIAHDIRTPLTSISLNVQILRRKLVLSADDREHLDIALEELARLDRSVAEILEFAKPVKLTSEPIDVGELLETATRGLGPVLSEKGVALRCEPGGALPVVNGDAQRLRQVLANLVGNAADASQPGAHVTVRARPADATHVAIEVEDHGRGITADDLPRIFEPFFTTRPDGTGLGLAIVHKVVRAHGGDIRVRSIVGEGSTFTVVLPAAS